MVSASSRSGATHISETFKTRAPLIRVSLGEFTKHPSLFTPEIGSPVRAVSALAGYLERLKQREKAGEPRTCLVHADRNPPGRSVLTAVIPASPPPRMATGVRSIAVIALVLVG